MRPGFFIAAAIMTVVAAVVMPLLTAPAETNARSARQQLPARVDSLTTVLGRARTRADSAAVRRRLTGAREDLAAADDHLLRVTKGRSRHWSFRGPGTVLVAFAVVLMVGALVMRHG